ncbi:hypothetical protein BDN70DRAFT_801800 [Pholiota conissans]|uniref:RRM domain-containing protein n=1 Tax=Pholiota conissans TaxID=109636 RepID=A0A9P6D3B3_9AGAR|nr:hypothetical protein BDN70DRAFT_801800 [Pholiota conissans]
MKFVKTTEIEQRPYARSNDFHGPKRQLVGNPAAHVAPSWRPNAPGQSSLSKGKGTADSGSKIFLSRLPFDVGEKEVEELFNKTVGPLKESFLVYNSQGKSKGMAVVTFQRPGDALVARAKYNGRIVDGRRGIKIEIMVDSDMPTRPTVPSTPSLFERLAPSPAQNSASMTAPTQNNASVPTGPRQHAVTRPALVAPSPKPAAIKKAPIPPRRFKQKKGPKRLKKQQQVTVADLDKEMEDYRASAPDFLGL